MKGYTGPDRIESLIILLETRPMFCKNNGLF